MTDMESTQIRAVIHFLWKQGKTNTEITLEMKGVYGEEAPPLRTVQYWTKRFNEGDEKLEDKPRSGRPRKDHLVPVVASLLDENPFLSQKKIAKLTSTDHKIIHRILTEDLGLTRVNFRWIPYCLSQSQKDLRVEFSKSLLETLSKVSLNMVITGDETWIHLKNPRAFMWIDSSVPRPERPKLTVGSKKSLCLFFGIQLECTQ